MTRPRGIVALVIGILTLLPLIIAPASASVETRAYQPAVTFGHEGREAGEFRQPSSVIVDHAGHLYVADTYNHRIQIFAADGRFLAAFGSEGTQRGALSRPKGLGWGPNQGLYVADTGNHRVQAFDPQGQVLWTLGGFGTGPGEFNAPEGLAVDSAGTLYVADTLNHRVQKFAPDGRFLLSWGSSGSGKGEFLGPTDIALDREGRVLVADTQNHRIQVFTSSGQYLWEIGRAGHGVAEFDSPRSVASDDEGQIYVADTGNGRIQIFDRRGRYLAQVGHLGKRPGEFYYPAAVWVDGRRSLYVADTINHRVQVLAYFPALARLEQGWQAFHAARFDVARAAWHDALGLDPTLAEALYGIGLTYARQGQLDLAIDHLNAALLVQPGYSEARWALYRAYIGKSLAPLVAVGVLVSAAAGLLVIRRLRRRVLRERARRFLEEGRIRETIVTYERLLQFDRNDLEVCKTLENLYEQEGLENKRKQVNEIIARLEPENLQALSYLGKQLFAERRLMEAQQTWEQVLRQNPTWAEAHFYLGAVQAERGQHEPAMLAFQRALSQAMAGVEPSGQEAAADSRPPAESQLAAILDAWEKVLSQGAAPYAQAQASFQQARALLAQRYVQQGQEHLQRDDAKEAIGHLRWVRALTPTDDAARALLKQAQTSLTFEQGLRYYQAQDYVQALRCFRDTLALDPEHDKAKRYLRYAQQCLEGGVSERFRHLDLGDREKS
jgi:DNA-binding beta-propeller fold protein YncE/Flp pilus assembly protein TadD